MLGYYERKAVRGLRHAAANLAYAILQPARHDVARCDVAGREATRLPTFYGEATRQPVCLSGYVVVDFGKAEGFKPTRGSRAQVSYRVPAVDDDRPLWVEAGNGAPVELLQGQVDRTLKVSCLVPVWRQDLDKLSVLPKQLLHPSGVDLGHRPRSIAQVGGL